MLEDQTMRIVLGGVTLTVLVLFYLGVYRPTKSRFSDWWTLSLVFATIARALLFLNGTDLQGVTNRASIVLGAVGVTCVWFATRSLRRERLPLWLLAAAPVGILAVRLVESAAGGAWVGNRLLFLYMSSMFVAASVETWLDWRARRATADTTPNGEPVMALLVTAIAGSVFATFYAVRAVTQVVDGPGGDSAELAGFTGSDSMILLVCLVAVTFSVSAASWDQQTQELHRRAMRDDLTGLLSRTEFGLQGERALAEAHSTGTLAMVVAADLDQFKDINDVHGHAAGDRTLVGFATAVTTSPGPGEVAGRQGGDEFAVVLRVLDEAEARARVGAIDDAYSTHAESMGFALPTVSYGLAAIDDGQSLATIHERADQALYVAKAQGGDRAVPYTQEIGRRPSSLVS